MRNDFINQYVKYGWTVVPVVKGEKRPAINWKDYQNRKPTNDEIKEWFKDPDTGCGIITGRTSGVIVVDEDSYKAQGIEARLETPLVVKTGGGGKHYYFKYQEGVHNSVNRNNAIDVRGEGGFVVVPPTRHPSGNNYEWLLPLPEDLSALPTLDESFAKQVAKMASSKEPIKIPEFMGLGKGERNDGVHRLACSFLNKFDEDTAYLMLTAVNNTFDPPLDERELDTTFKSAVRFIREHPKESPIKSSAEPLQVISFAEAKAKYEELITRYGSGVTTGYKVLDSYFKLVPQQLYMISATTHTGKTTLVLNMAGRCAREGHKVVVASLEQGVFVIPRIESMFGDPKGMENLFFIAPNDLPKPEDILQLFTDAGNRPKVLIIDHLHYFDRGNRGATEEMDRLVVQMQRLAKHLEIPVVVVAHVRKLNQSRSKEGKESPPTMEDLKDSNSLSQIPSVVAMLHRNKNSDEIIQAGGSHFSDNGTLYIYKNRIFGRTGSEDFILHNNGEIVFRRDPDDRIKHESIAQVGLEGFFD